MQVYIKSKQKQQKGGSGGLAPTVRNKITEKRTTKVKIFPHFLRFYIILA